ncbi:hypothetical protein SmJEL517_g05894 [Synchytrium microbalum]|uniref:Centromere protein J C-terminal domain-containing protein n=1 Tax=Synchytrium microbalum TaxID=1806994 RepID=A0A507BT75_9FUNG|nr:uncharacterized protein SmJEL517_g05894 [Synchytrium microbalum]TPX30558.1 hypothetical protein SmJEL517_g05894 [Synchytrium microbalum]
MLSDERPISTSGISWETSVNRPFTHASTLLTIAITGSIDKQQQEYNTPQSKLSSKSSLIRHRPANVPDNVANDEDDDEDIEARVLAPARAMHENVWRELVQEEAASLRDFELLEAQIMKDHDEDDPRDQVLMDVDLDVPEDIQEGAEDDEEEHARAYNSILYSETDHGSPDESLKSFSENDEDTGMLEDHVDATVQAQSAPSAPSKLLFSLFPSLKPVVEAVKPVESAGLIKRFMHTVVPAPASAVERATRPEEAVSKETKRSVSKEKDVRQVEFLMRKLKLEQDAFDEYKHQEMEKIRVTRVQELKNLRREKIAWDQQRKVADLVPTKRERQELESLKKKIDDMSNIAKQRESRLQLTIDRLKRQVDTLTKRNMELQDEVRVLEHDRVAHVVLQKETTLPLVIKHTQSSLDIPTAGLGGLAGASTSTSSLVKVHQRHSGSSDTGLKPTAAVVQQQHLKPKQSAIPVAVTPITAVSGEPDSTLVALAEKLGVTGTYKDIPVGESKLERVFDNGVKLVWYRNGTTKEMYPDGNIVVRFVNGDYKRVTSNKHTVYWYAEPRTLHTTHPDGLQIYEFANGQVEKHYPDSREIHFPDGTKKYIFADGDEECVFPDGSYARRHATKAT